MDMSDIVDIQRQVKYGHCQICKLQQGTGHWAWHQYCRAEINPVALIQFIEHQKYPIQAHVLIGYIVAVTGMDLPAARAALEKEVKTNG